MNNNRTKRLPKIIASQFGVILLIALIGLSVLFYAQGYRYNRLSHKIQKTGVVFLSSYPRGATVIIDGKTQTQKTPFTKNLSAGYYNAKIVKDGYEPWSINFKIESELVDSYKSIVLYKSNIKIKTLSDQKKIALLNASDDILAATNKDQIKIKGNEIWQNDELITRFSEPVLNAIWYPDGDHIIYQRGNEIRSIEITGFNDTLLVKLSSDKIAKIATNEKGDELYFTDGDVYKIATIR